MSSELHEVAAAIMVSGMRYDVLPVDLIDRAMQLAIDATRELYLRTYDISLTGATNNHRVAEIIKKRLLDES
jgi:hypothetical protein